MNKQLKTEGGNVVGRGIEWTDFTWNPVGGCRHGCKWRMPDGTIAICYADSTTKGMPTAYPHGFEHHYWRPHMLVEPQRQKQPSKIFMDSMSDLMGQWVPDIEIKQVFDVCRLAHWHHFQLLTKNAPRLLKFNIPKNVWVGVSAPPTFMFGKELTPDQQRSMVWKQLDTLKQLKERGHPVCWMSIEPISFDIADVMTEWKFRDPHAAAGYTERLPLDWVVIGAASNGPKHFQPNPEFVAKTHALMRLEGAAIFHKGNLKWDPHLEEFPDCVKEFKQESML